MSGPVCLDNDQGSKVLRWGSDMEPETINQAFRAADMPFVSGHVALMPDAHVGIGATVGSVIPTQGAIMPAAVGVDIGCGMVAVETTLGAADLPDNLDALMPLIEARIPAGVGKGHAIGALMPSMLWRGDLTAKQSNTADVQFGSLGSGNHFVEVCLDERDVVWIVLHSGSRGIGNQLAQKHIADAKGLMKRYFVCLDDADLAYFVEGTPEFAAYIRDMTWAQEYAFQSRERMALRAREALFGLLGTGFAVRTINCHHNFTQKEHHGTRDLWITRKGAIRAREGDLGVIPGSMGTRSYIVSGNGVEASYCSCSHGAGRRMSRKQARRELTVESLTELMYGKSWNAEKADALLDEHPSSYKDIDQVMADQADLVTVQHTLSQIFNFKGA